MYIFSSLVSRDSCRHLFLALILSAKPLNCIFRSGASERANTKKLRRLSRRIPAVGVLRTVPYGVAATRTAFIAPFVSKSFIWRPAVSSAVSYDERRDTVRVTAPVTVQNSSSVVDSQNERSIAENRKIIFLFV